MKKALILTAVAAMGLGLAACDSATENKAESQAQDVREASEAAADSIESVPGSGDMADDKADAVRETGDAKADAMEDAADKKDAGTPE